MRDALCVVQSVIDDISNISSSNAKQERLSFYFELDIPYLYDIICDTYDPRIKHNLTSSGIDNLAIEFSDSPECFLDLLTLLSEGTLTQKKKMYYISNHIEDSGELNLLKQIVDGQLKHSTSNKTWGLSIKSINKVLKKHNLMEIYTPKYMRCSLPNDKIMENFNFPAITQRKEDSEYVNIFCVDGQIWFESRRGLIYTLPYIEEDLRNSLQWERDFVISGELMIDDDSLSRTEMRSKVSSYVKREQTLTTLQDKYDSAKSHKQREKILAEITWRNDEYYSIGNKLIISAWDIIPYGDNNPYGDYQQGKCNISYQQRFDILKYEIENVKKLRLVNSKLVDTLEEAQVYFQEQLDQGFEGIILKDLNGVWADGTSKQQVKFKSEKECELIIVGVNPGDGAFTGGIGSYQCESSDGLVKVNISGMTIEERGLERIDPENSALGLKPIEGFNMNSMIGKIITVRFNELIKGKSSDVYSLYLPRIVQVRDDKIIADDLEYIKGL